MSYPYLLRRARRGLLALVCVCAALGVTRAPAQPIEIRVEDGAEVVVGEAFYGIQYHRNTYGDPLALAKLSEIPLYGVRLWAYPSEFHPAPDRWDWEALDAKIAEVVAAGYEPFVCLFQAEDWYTGTPEDPWWNEEAAREEWAAAARALAARYRDEVDWWIIFDEINYLHPDRGYYMPFPTSAALYLDAAREIKSVDDRAFVGGPSGFSGWENGHWANYVLALDGGSDYLDFVASNLFLSWNRHDTDAEIMDRTVWYEEAPLKIRRMIGGKDDPWLLLDAYNASALWTIDGTPGGELWTDPRNVSTFGGVYQTAALLHSAKGGFDVTLRWETLGGYGILSWYPDFEARPPYYAWLLLTRHGRLTPGSVVVPASTTEPPMEGLPHHGGENVAGYAVQPFAVRNADGISVILVNKYESARQVVVSKPEGMAGYDLYRFDDDRHETSLDVLSSGDEERIDLDLPGVSVTVLSFEANAATGVDMPDPGAARTGRLQNSPNPFASTTTISCSLAAAGEVRLDVYTLLGQHVSTLFSGHLPAGPHTFTFEAGGLSAGTYVYKLCVDGACASRPMVLLR